jgi:putative DNA primase/helicase
MPSPPLRRYKVTDASVEALGEILIDNPWGTLAYRDELNGLLRSLDKEGQEGARAFYLQGYDGNQSYTFDRIMRGRYRHIDAVCLSLLGGIQPGKLQSYIRDALSGGAGDDGLLQRFGLLVWPDVQGEWINVDRWPDTDAKKDAFETFQRLDALLPSLDAESGQEVPTVYRFSPEAQNVFDEWRHELEASLRSGEHHPAMESHLAKYRKLVPAMALVCALADSETEVSATSLTRALAWSEYLQTHAQRAYAAGARPATDGAKALLAKIVDKKVVDGFKSSDVYLKGWSSLSSPEEAHAAAYLLCDLGILRRIEKPPGEKGGRPSTGYQINPKTLESL